MQNYRISQYNALRAPQISHPKPKFINIITQTTPRNSLTKRQVTDSHFKIQSMPLFCTRVFDITLSWAHKYPPLTSLILRKLQAKSFKKKSKDNTQQIWICHKNRPAPNTTHPSPKTEKEFHRIYIITQKNTIFKLPQPTIEKINPQQNGSGKKTKTCHHPKWANERKTPVKTVWNHKHSSKRQHRAFFTPETKQLNEILQRRRKLLFLSSHLEIFLT